MAETAGQTQRPTAPSAPTVQVRLVTKTETPIPSTPIVIPTDVTRYSLSQILNHLLENPQPIPYSFLIHSVYLPSSLDEYITANGISREEILEIEYVRSILPPQWQGQWTQEDWVSGVSVRDNGVVSSGYDGVVRVWDWSGNVIAKSKTAPGALRALKTVKWIEGGFVTGGMDGSVRVWSHSDSGVSLTVEGKGHEGSVDSVDYRDGKVISAGADGTLKVWSVDPSEAVVPQTQRKKRKTESAHAVKSCSTTSTPLQGLPLTAVMFHPTDNSIAYTASLSTHLHTHDLLSESPEPVSSTPFNAPLLSITSLHPTSLLGLGTTTNRILLHDPRSQSITVNIFNGHEGFVSSLSPSPDNPNIFASGSYDSHIRIWDIRNPTGSIFRLDRPSGAGKVLAIDWNTKGLIAGGQDGKLDIWTGNTTSMAKL